MPSSLTFLQATDASGATTTTTFSAVNIGAADPNRYIIVAFSLFNFSNTGKANTVSIGGTNATIVAQTATGGTADTFVGFAYLNVPTGTTANIVIGQGDFQNHQIIGVYRYVPALAPIVIVDSGAQTAGAGSSKTLNTNADGSVIAVVSAQGTTGGTFTWTNVTSDNDHTLGSATSGSHFATASANVSAGTLAVTLSTTFSNSISFLSIAPTAAAVESGTIAQTLKLVTQSATGQQWTKGAIAQRLKLITQSSVGWAEAIGSAAQTLFKITQLASPATQIFTGTAAQRLNLVTQAASGWHTIFGAAAQTLFRVTQAVVGQQWIQGVAAQTLKLIKQSATSAVSGIFGPIHMTLKLIRQNGVGAEWAQGSVAQMLPLVRQTVGGWAEIIGNAAQMLPLIQQLINANEVTLETLFFATTRQLNDYVGRIQKQIRSTWHGPPDDPLPPVQ